MTDYIWSAHTDTSWITFNHTGLHDVIGTTATSFTIDIEEATSENDEASGIILLYINGKTTEKTIVRCLPTLLNETSHIYFNCTFSEKISPCGLNGEDEIYNALNFSNVRIVREKFIIKPGQTDPTKEIYEQEFDNTDRFLKYIKVGDDNSIYTDLIPYNGGRDRNIYVKLVYLDDQSIPCEWVNAGTQYGTVNKEPGDVTNVLCGPAISRIDDIRVSNNGVFNIKINGETPTDIIESVSCSKVFENSESGKIAGFSNDAMVEVKNGGWFAKLCCDETKEIKFQDGTGWSDCVNCFNFSYEIIGGPDGTSEDLNAHFDDNNVLIFDPNTSYSNDKKIVVRGLIEYGLSEPFTQTAMSNNAITFIIKKSTTEEDCSDGDKPTLHVRANKQTVDYNENTVTFTWFMSNNSSPDEPLNYRYFSDETEETFKKAMRDNVTITIGSEEYKVDASNIGYNKDTGRFSTSYTVQKNLTRNDVIVTLTVSDCFLSSNKSDSDSTTQKALTIYLNLCRDGIGNINYAGGTTTLRFYASTTQDTHCVYRNIITDPDVYNSTTLGIHCDPDVHVRCEQPNFNRNDGVAEMVVNFDENLEGGEYSFTLTCKLLPEEIYDKLTIIQDARAKISLHVEVSPTTIDYSGNSNVCVKYYAYRTGDEHETPLIAEDVVNNFYSQDVFHIIKKVDNSQVFDIADWASASLETNGIETNSSRRYENGVFTQYFIVDKNVTLNEITYRFGVCHKWLTDDPPTSFEWCDLPQRKLEETQICLYGQPETKEINYTGDLVEFTCITKVCDTYIEITDSSITANTTFCMAEQYQGVTIEEYSNNIAKVRFTGNITDSTKEFKFYFKNNDKESNYLTVTQKAYNLKVYINVSEDYDKEQKEVVTLPGDEQSHFVLTYWAVLNGEIVDPETVSIGYITATCDPTLEVFVPEFIETITLGDGKKQTKLKVFENDKNAKKSICYKAVCNGFYSDQITVILLGRDMTILPDFDYMTFRYDWGENDGKDLDTATFIAGINEDDPMYDVLCTNYVGYGGIYPGVRDWQEEKRKAVSAMSEDGTVIRYMEHGGDNTQSGLECALVYWKNVCNHDYISNGTKEIYCDLYAVWFQYKCDAKCTLNFTLYKYKTESGEIIAPGDEFKKVGIDGTVGEDDNYNFGPKYSSIVQTGSTQVIDNISVFAHGHMYGCSNSVCKPLTTYTHIARFTYDILSKTHYFNKVENDDNQSKGLWVDVCGTCNYNETICYISSCQYGVSDSDDAKILTSCDCNAIGVSLKKVYGPNDTGTTTYMKSINLTSYGICGTFYEVSIDDLTTSIKDNSGCETGWLTSEINANGDIILDIVEIDPDETKDRDSMLYVKCNVNGEDRVLFTANIMQDKTSS